MSDQSSHSRCPVCGGELAPRSERLIRAWPGQYAHVGCASYARRPRGGSPGTSHRVYRKFTRT